MKCCFIHVPKCGGSSIKKELRFRLRWKNPFGFKESKLNGVAARELASLGDYSNLQVRELLLQYELANAKSDLIFGHYRCTAKTISAFESQYRFITILRDPIDRWISSYYYNRFKKSDYFKIDLDLDEYLKSEIGRKEGTAFIRFFSNTEGYKISDAQIMEAVDTIGSFHVVGFLEDLDGFSNEVSDTFSIKFKNRIRNANPASDYEEARKAIKEQYYDNIKTICTPDLEFMSAATSRFQSN